MSGSWCLLNLKEGKGLAPSTPSMLVCGWCPMTCLYGQKVSGSDNYFFEKKNILMFWGKTFKTFFMIFAEKKIAVKFKVLIG